MLMNGDFLLGQARAMAERVRRETAAESADPLARQAVGTWRIGYGREPDGDELRLATAFLAEAKAAAASTSDPELEALTSLCQTMLGSNEFLYVD